MVRDLVPLEMLESGAWLRNAEQANRMAEQLELGLQQIPGVEFISRRQASQELKFNGRC